MEGGRGALTSPRASGFGQEAERVDFNTGGRSSLQQTEGNNALRVCLLLKLSASEETV